jgi:hypothetical protein
LFSCCIATFASILVATRANLSRGQPDEAHSGVQQRRQVRELEWRRRRRRRRRRLAALGVLVLVAPVFYSYVSTMLQPSSLPLGIRSIEWLRGHGGAWLVNDVERLYYQWTAPKKGGPTLRALPRVGTAGLRVTKGPAPVSPLIRPALVGEGRWRSTGSVIAGAPAVLVTTFRSDPSYPRIVAYVAWIDHSRTRLALYPGRYEPPRGSPRGPMSVPLGERSRLLATFNSGFTNKDGHGGFAVNGTVYEPLRRAQATVVADRNGKVDVVSWTQGSAPGARIVLARQNLPLIVDRGRRAPDLADGSEWGATLGNAIRVWRSGIGIDRHGNLLYAAADYQTVGSLADIFVHAGAVRAMELDINAEWPSFITYGRGVQDPVKLVPNAQQSARRYLVPDDRDFFAVLALRAHSSALVPFK